MKRAVVLALFALALCVPLAAALESEDKWHQLVCDHAKQYPLCEPQHADKFQEALRAVHSDAWACTTVLQLAWKRYLRARRLPASDPFEFEFPQLVAQCRRQPTPRPAPGRAPPLVLMRLHNGLGNQMFQFAFGRLMARALGARHLLTSVRDGEEQWGARKLNTPTGGEGEASWAVKPKSATPPNTVVGSRALAMISAEHITGWAELPPFVQQACAAGMNETTVTGAIATHFDSRTLTLDDRYDFLTPISLQVLEAMRRRAPCTRVLGYFLRPAIFNDDARNAVAEWVPTPPDRVALPQDVVVHVRRFTKTNMHNGALMGHPPQDFYDCVLNKTLAQAVSRGQLTGRVLLLTHLRDRDPIVQQLQERYGAMRINKEPSELARRSLNYADRVDMLARLTAQDFNLLRSAHTMVISDSTFSSMASWLSEATTVHVPFLSRCAEQPGHGSVALLGAHSPRMVFHDPRCGRFFGHSSLDGQVRFDVESLPRGPIGQPRLPTVGF